MFQLTRSCGIDQCAQVLLPDSGPHHAWIASGKENVRKLPVLGDVVAEQLDVLALELLFRADLGELRPSKTVSAVRVAPLSLRREKEHGLPVLLLSSRNSNTFPIV